MNNNSIPTLGISLDGVIRDMHSQFDKVYRKFFINNEELIKADENFQYAIEEENEQAEYGRLLDLTDEKIHLPVDTADLMNHYRFDAEEKLNTLTNEHYTIDAKTVFKTFLQNYAYEIFASANQFPRSYDTANHIKEFGKVNKMFNTVLLIKAEDKIIASTYHFLAKGGCKIEKVVFVKEDFDKWNYCDVLVDDSPESFETKPENKISIKIKHDYNKYSPADFDKDNINLIFDELFLLQVFKPEKYKEIIEKQK
jgi:hypothetical protein